MIDMTKVYVAGIIAIMTITVASIAGIVMVGGC